MVLPDWMIDRKVTGSNTQLNACGVIRGYFGINAHRVLWLGMSWFVIIDVVDELEKMID